MSKMSGSVQLTYQSRELNNVKLGEKAFQYVGSNRIIHDFGEWLKIREKVCSVATIRGWERGMS